MIWKNIIFSFIFSFVANLHHAHSLILPSSSLSPSSPPILHASKYTLDVCLSPGCVADGAEKLFMKMHALSLTDVTVNEGVCCSLCGNGPVVLDKACNKKYKKVSDQKLIDLLFEGGAIDEKRQAILDAINVVSEANIALKSRNYDEAVALFEKGISIGMIPTLDINESNYDRSELALTWLVSARQNEARARLQIKDLNGALFAATNARELSKEKSFTALELLQEIYQLNGDTRAELEVLKVFFALPEPKKVTTFEANKRRELGFRVAKLQRELEK